MHMLSLHSPLFWAALACFISFVLQLYFTLGIYARLAAQSKETAGDKRRHCPALSVIIIAKDAASYLEQNLPAVLEQDYPDFEVIVVCDRSSAADEDVLKRMTEQYPHLYHTFIPGSARYVSHKKLGIAMGIRASRHEWLVFTEPDCRPESNQWLRTLANEMTESTEIVLGYSNFTPSSKFIARYRSTRVFIRSLRYLSMALSGHPYIGIGSNLAYKKSLYEQHKGFANHLNLLRGEDDLFINAVAQAGNTRVARGKNSVIRITSYQDVLRRKEEYNNRLITSRFYKGGAPLANATETLTNFSFHIGACLSIILGITSCHWILAGCIFSLWLLRFVLRAYIFRTVAHSFDEDFCCTLPLSDILNPLHSLADRVRYLRCNKHEYLRR